MSEHILAATGHHGPGHLLAALAPVLVVLIIFDVYCLRDLARAESVRHLPKWVWALIILFVSEPGGGLLYLFVGRERGQRSRVPG
jgi:Phospholipase_D-nuclease N-terminal